jgi:hypothetical protein
MFARPGDRINSGPDDFFQRHGFLLTVARLLVPANSLSGADSFSWPGKSAANSLRPCQRAPSPPHAGQFSGGKERRTGFFAVGQQIGQFLVAEPAARGG